MKSLRRYFCVLLSCVLLLGAFSVSVKAVSADDRPFHIYTQVYTFASGYGSNTGNATFYPNNGTEEAWTFQTTVPNSTLKANSNWHSRTYYTLSFDDKSAIVQAGGNTEIIIENFFFYNELHSASGSLKNYIKPDSAEIRIEYADGTSIYADSYEIITKSSVYGNIDIKFRFTPTKDVARIEIAFVKLFNDSFFQEQVNAGYGMTFTYQIGEMNGDQYYKLYINQQTEEAGLLSGILGWIENIWDSVTDGFTDMKNGITNIVNKITDLPRLLWEKIETGLKNLFVPDDEYIVGYKDRWDELLADRLGAVYEVVNVTFESWDKINVSDATNTVDMPKVTIPLPDDEEFSFGGFPVKIVPDGFETLVTACKLIVGIVCTIMFVNGLRKRYDEVMGVEQ